MPSVILGFLVFALLIATSAALPEYGSHSSTHHSTSLSPVKLVSSHRNGLAPGAPTEEANNNNFIPTTTSPSYVATASNPVAKVAVDTTPIILRPTVKPHLLTDFEFETMWDPRMDTLRLGVLLPFSSNKTVRETSLVRKGLTVCIIDNEHVQATSRAFAVADYRFPLLILIS